MKYTHVQYTGKQGEIGPAFAGQNRLKIFHEGFLNADNVDINQTGLIQIRNGFRYQCAAPITDVARHYKVVTFFFRKQDEDEDEVELQYRVVIFHENTLSVYAVDPEDGTLTFKCSKVTNREAAFMSACTHTEFSCQAGGEAPGILFANRLAKPFILRWTGDADQANHFTLTECTLKKVPLHEFIKDDRTGTVLGTGPISIQPMGQAYYEVRATNSCFTTALCADYYGKRISIVPNTQFRVLRRKNDTTLDCSLIQNLGASNNIAPEDFTLHLGWEPIVSGTRGWFDCVCFYDNRLFFAGTKDLPNAVVGSTAEDIFDFSLGIQNENDGCFAELDFGQRDTITALSRGSTLHVFTVNSLYVASVGGGTITPATFDFTQVSSCGGGDLFTDTPQTNEGGLIYIDSKHNQLNYVSYDRASESYTPVSLSVMMPEGTIEQSSDTFSLTLLNEGTETGQNAFFINKDGEMIKVLLNLSDEFIPCYTRYKFSKITEGGVEYYHACPIKLFRCANFLYGIFFESATTTISILKLSTGGAMDFCYDVQFDDDGFGQLPVSYPAFTRAKLMDLTTGALRDIRIPNNRIIEIPDLAGHLVQVGIPFQMLLQTMERIGDPNEVPNTTGKRKTGYELRMDLQEVSNLQVAIADHQKLGSIYWKTVVDVPYFSYKTEVRPFRWLRGHYQRPVILMRTTKPARFVLNPFAVDLSFEK